MDKKAKLLFMIVFSLFGLIALIVITMSFFETNDNYSMGVDTLVNNLREDTQNYKNVNKGHLERYMGKTFTITGPLYSYDSENKQLVFDSIRMVVYGKLENKELNSNEKEALKKIKRGFTAKIKGKFDKVGGFLTINEAKIIKLFDEKYKLLIDNE